jgi:hypothetical protein
MELYRVNYWMGYCFLLYVNFVPQSVNLIFFKEDKIVFYKIGCQFKTETFKYTSMKWKKREKIYLNS